MKYKPSGKEEAQFLKNFDASKYQNPAVAADTALFAVDDKSIYLLLIERGGFPYKGCWALPGGFVNIDEDCIDSAKRELKEETGVDINYIEQAAVWAEPNRDPRQRVITVSYIALIDFGDAKATAGDDAAKAEWFKISSYKKTIAEQTTVCFTLSGQEEILAEVTYPNNQIAQVECIASGGLAFDHAESIATSIELLKKRADIISSISLGSKKAAHAAKVINNV